MTMRPSTKSAKIIPRPVSSKKLVSGVGVAEWDGRWAGGELGAAAAAAVLSNCILIGS